MKIVTSKFKTESIFSLIWILLSTIGVLFFMIKAATSAKETEILPTILFELFFASLLLLSLVVLKDFKYIQVNSAKKEIKYYSLIAPFGKRIILTNFKGMIKSTEATSYGKINTIHLVNKEMFTQFKIMGTYYKNFDEIVEAIPIEEIKKYNFGFWKYLKLIFTGKIKITPHNKH